MYILCRSHKPRWPLYTCLRHLFSQPTHTLILYLHAQTLCLHLCLCLCLCVLSSCHTMTFFKHRPHSHPPFFHLYALFRTQCRSLSYICFIVSLYYVYLSINATPDILPLYVSLSLIFHLATFSIHVPLESFIISFTLLSMLSPITTLRHPFKDLVLHPPTYHILLSLSL